MQVCMWIGAHMVACKCSGEQVHAHIQSNLRAGRCADGEGREQVHGQVVMHRGMRASNRQVGGK